MFPSLFLFLFFYSNPPPHIISTFFGRDDGWRRGFFFLTMGKETGKGKEKKNQSQRVKGNLAVGKGKPTLPSHPTHPPPTKNNNTYPFFSENPPLTKFPKIMFLFLSFRQKN